jgi:hypothetical protein
VLRRILGPKSDEVTGEWRKLHTEELNDLYSSHGIVRVIKSRMRWAGNVARMGRVEACTGYWWGNLRERDHWGDPVVDGWIVLIWIFQEVGGGGMDWIEPTQDRECINETAEYFLTS